jgi:hypothetical protein
MKLRDPKARDSVDGRPDGRVDVGGTLVPVDGDGYFEHAEITREWAEQYARREGVSVATVLPKEREETPSDSSDGSPTCAGKDGECSREVDELGAYCWQHS